MKIVYPAHSQVCLSGQVSKRRCPQPNLSMASKPGGGPSVRDLTGTSPDRKHCTQSTSSHSGKMEMPKLLERPSDHQAVLDDQCMLGYPDLSESSHQQIEAAAGIIESHSGGWRDYLACLWILSGLGRIPNSSHKPAVPHENRK